ncbi:DUF4158 domain-containing protein [Rhodococcus sp. WS3]|uniref:DUF4158 domain-containing protein n=1 Tax=Rhodococcus sp. WS3 TaxID=2486271 RepID=UPI00165168B2|nr:DUF4158 domain-containing protein [Rhodococcus sp. WS3]
MNNARNRCAASGERKNFIARSRYRARRGNRYPPRRQRWLLPRLALQRRRGELKLGRHEEFPRRPLPHPGRPCRNNRQDVCALPRSLHLHAIGYEAAKARAVAEQAIRAAEQTEDDPADLISVALEELVRARYELPGYTMLDLITKPHRS